MRELCRIDCWPNHTRFTKFSIFLYDKRCRILWYVSCSFYCSSNLNHGTSVPDFLLAAKNPNDGYISKQKGYISWKQLVDGDTCADFITVETMEDVKKFEADSGNSGELAQAFYSFLNLNSCKQNYFTIERSYE